MSTTLLFIDKVFLKKRKDLPLRGVELFNLNLLRDLVAEGLDVTFLAESSWKEDVEGFLGQDLPNCNYVSGLGIDFLNALAAARSVKAKTFDVLLLGNVGNGIIPAIKMLRRAKAFSRCVLIAHREATGRFVQLLKGMPGHVLAVNKLIAKPFVASGHPSVHIDYGIMNADRFHPAETKEGSDGVTHLCVVGMLDNAWKGADTAVSAFRALPEAVRETSKLHLCSFTNPPTMPEENIITYPWMDASELPALLGRMDVMLVPSRDEDVMRETFSQVVVQGMLTELPVIVSNLPVLTEKVDEGGGLVFDRVEELTDAMNLLISDVALRKKLGKEARHIALDRYVWDTSRFVTKYVASTGAIDNL